MINKWLFAIGAQLLLPSLLNAQTILGLDEPSRFTKLRPMLQVAATSTVLNARKHANLKAFVTQGVRMRYETISIKKPKGIPINGSFSLHEIGSAVDIGLVDDRHLRSVLALYAYHSGLSMPVESDRVHFELDWDIERLRYKRSALELSINRYVKENLKKVSNKNELEKEIREVFNLSEKVKIKITGAEINVWIE